MPVNAHQIKKNAHLYLIRLLLQSGYHLSVVIVITPVASGCSGLGGDRLERAGRGLKDMKAKSDLLNEILNRLWRERYCGTLLVNFSSGLIQEILKDTTKK
jgi:hypothetical protein